MINSNRSDSLEFGFLTVVPDQRDGLFGGLLVLNVLGRPLEFHCTAPIKPNRAQEILYGPTLKEYLYAEQIGKSLVNHASASLSFIVTDVAELLSLRQHISNPVVLVRGDSQTEGQDNHLRFDEAHQSNLKLTFSQSGNSELAVATQHESDLELVNKWIEPLRDSFDLLEPFSRIREAIAEAQHGARSKADQVTRVVV